MPCQLPGVGPGLIRASAAIFWPTRQGPWHQNMAANRTASLTHHLRRAPGPLPIVFSSLRPRQALLCLSFPGPIRFQTVQSAPCPTPIARFTRLSGIGGRWILSIHGRIPPFYGFYSKGVFQNHFGSNSLAAAFVRQQQFRMGIFGQKEPFLGLGPLGQDPKVQLPPLGPTHSFAVEPPVSGHPATFRT